MARKTQNLSAKEHVENEELMARSPANQPTTVNDLEQLRDILYGNQARATEERLNRLERELDATRQQMLDTFSERIDELRESTQEQLASLRQQLVESLDQQGDQQSEQLQETQTEYDNKIKQQQVELDTTKKDFSTTVEQLSATFDQNLSQNQKEFREQVEKISSEFQERLHTYKEESNKRDDDLRLEFMALGAWLDDKKASRHDLGLMIVEIGQLLQQEKEPSMDDPKKE